MKYFQRKLNNIDPLFVLQDLLLVVDEESYPAKVYICGQYQTEKAVSIAELGELPTTVDERNTIVAKANALHGLLSIHTPNRQKYKEICR